MIAALVGNKGLQQLDPLPRDAPARKELPLPAAPHTPDQVATGFGRRHSLFRVVALVY